MINYYVEYIRPTDNKRCATINYKDKTEAQRIAEMFIRQGLLEVKVKEIRY